MNKAQLIDALAERLGDRKVAAAAVAGLIDLVVRTVDAGERVTITGFGVFEKRARAARTARNPRTGQAVMVQQTDVPAFRPGALFREVISGIRTLSTGDGAVAVAGPVTSRPATRRSAVPLATAQPAKAPKVKEAVKAAKVAKAAKASKSEPKGTGKGPSKPAAKKAGKKSASKK